MMNEHDIDEMVDFTARWAPEFERYARYLADWKDVVNSNSDGWPYWKAGSSCAAKLSAALQDVRRSLRDGSPMPSDDVFQKALSPIKAAATKHGLTAPALAPRGIVAQDVKETELNIFVAEVETRSTQSHGYGASAEEAVAALLRCWQEQYAPSTRADPDYLTGMREEIVIYSVELGRGYVIGPHDNFARTFVARGDHDMFDPVFAGASARPAR